MSNNSIPVEITAIVLISNPRNILWMSEFQSGLGYHAKSAPDTIYLLDTETTGLRGGEFDLDPKIYASDPNEGDRLDALNWNAMGDLVLDIGICEISLSRGTVKPVFSSVVGYDTELWDESKVNSWIFDNSSLKLADVASAPRLSKVVADVKRMLMGKWVTSYNVQFDLDRFLYKFPWNMKGIIREVRDPMFSAAEVCKLENKDPNIKSYRFPRLEYAYEKILDGKDPAGINGPQAHRAMSDAMMASYVLLQMYKDGKYDPMDFTGRHSFELSS